MSISNSPDRPKTKALSEERNRRRQGKTIAGLPTVSPEYGSVIAKSENKDLEILTSCPSRLDLRVEVPRDRLQSPFAGRNEPVANYSYIFLRFFSLMTLAWPDLHPWSSSSLFTTTKRCPAYIASGRIQTGMLFKPCGKSESKSHHPCTHSDATHSWQIICVSRA